MKAFEIEDRNSLEEQLKNGYENARDTWLAGIHPDVFETPTPMIIVGKQVGESVEISKYEDENVEVVLQEVEAEWMYSNPTGYFNLSCPEKVRQRSNYQTISYSDFKQNMRAIEVRNAQEAK